MLSASNTAAMVIKTPRGIRFDCSGCGNCCLNWPVPLTDRDVRNISEHSNTGHAAPMRRLPASGVKMQTFTHSLEKRADGRCIFLAESRCELHSRFGEESKPSMCRLFPYTFSLTPSGVCASVSFASTGVLFNSGKLLSEQLQLLQERYEIFLDLFPHIEMNWNRAQIVDGIPLSLVQLNALCSDFNDIVESDCSDTCVPPSNMVQKLHRMSQRVLEDLPSAQHSERVPQLESSAEIVDQVILKYLEKLYFPQDVFAEDNFDLDIQGLMRELVSAPQTVRFGGEGKPTFLELSELKLGTLAPELEDLINRFFYCRIFSWLYFGPGFHHVSLLAGIHHLLHLDVLIRLKLKCILLEKGEQALDVYALAELVRTLERRLTQLHLSSQSKAGLDVLLPSASRAERIGQLAL